MGSGDSEDHYEPSLSYLQTVIWTIFSLFIGSIFKTVADISLTTLIQKQPFQLYALIGLFTGIIIGVIASSFAVLTIQQKQDKRRQKKHNSTRLIILISLVVVVFGYYSWGIIPHYSVRIMMMKDILVPPYSEPLIYSLLTPILSGVSTLLVIYFSRNKR